MTSARHRDLISLALIVSDSLDGSAKAVRTRVSEMKGTYRRATVLGRDFGYQQVPHTSSLRSQCGQTPRWTPDGTTRHNSADLFPPSPLLVLRRRRQTQRRT